VRMRAREDQERLLCGAFRLGGRTRIVAGILLIGPLSGIRSSGSVPADAQDPPQDSSPSERPREPATFSNSDTTSQERRIRDAADRGLAYLARRQERQGSWSNLSGWGEYPVAMTALAGLALLMDGNTPTQGRYAQQVDKAASFILRAANPNGLFSKGDVDARPMHGHGFAMLFLSQVYGMTEDKAEAEQIHEALTKAVKLTGQSQSPLGGWLYTPDARADEGSVTVTQIQGLRGCRNVGIAVPKGLIDQAMLYLDKSFNADGGIRYTASAPGPSRPAITAAAVVCWFNAGQFDNPMARQALEFCKQKIRPTSTSGGHDFYAHLYLSQALWVSSDREWAEYYRKRADFLLGLQEPDGSWEGDNVGEIYGTSIALIILQLPYSQLPIMQR